MSVPVEVRRKLREMIAELTDELQWDSISNAERAAHYDHWIEDPSIGGVLERYVDKAQVRVYIKDTLVKYVIQHRRGDDTRPLAVLGVSGAEVIGTHRKPHGRTLHDGRVICWGRADDWRSLILALYERTHGRDDLRPYGAVLLRAVGKYEDDAFRQMVQNASELLGIERLVWLEG